MLPKHKLEKFIFSHEITVSALICMYLCVREIVHSFVAPAQQCLLTVLSMRAANVCTEAQEFSNALDVNVHIQMHVKSVIAR